jgi:hypothetical protein
MLSRYIQRCLRLAQLPASLSFLALSFLFSSRSRGQFRGSAAFAGPPADDGSVPASCVLRQHPMWEWYSLSFRSRAPRPGLPSGSASKLCQDPRLIHRGERLPAGRTGFLLVT